MLRPPKSPPRDACSVGLAPQCRRQHALLNCTGAIVAPCSDRRSGPSCHRCGGSEIRQVPLAGCHFSFPSVDWSARSFHREVFIFVSDCCTIPSAVLDLQVEVSVCSTFSHKEDSFFLPCSRWPDGPSKGAAYRFQSRWLAPSSKVDYIPHLPKEGHSPQCRVLPRLPPLGTNSLVQRQFEGPLVRMKITTRISSRTFARIGS